ncbi:unnamed protein product [Peniophora sp. CBMAI 1063]|nr:unnamed protein product [Peniophora sp. CBMAI 1063]
MPATNQSTQPSANLINVCFPDEILMEVMKIASDNDPPTPPKRPWNSSSTEHQVEAPTEEDPYLPPSWTLHPSLAPANLLSPGCGYLGSAIIASQVCHRWRELALDHAALWANCIGLLPEQMDEMVLRCKSHPLSVVLYGSAERPHTDIVLQYLMEHKKVSCRVRSLTWYETRRSHFREHYYTSETPGFLARCDLSGLLHLNVFASEYDERGQAVAGLTPVDLTWYSTQFARLSLPSLVSADICDVSFMFCDLRNLTKLSWRWLEDPETLGMNENSMHLGLLVTCLREYQATLEELTLESGTYDRDYPNLIDLLETPDNQTDGHFKRLHFRRLRKLAIRERLWQPELVPVGDTRPDEPYALPVPLIYSTEAPMMTFFSLITYPQNCQLVLDIRCETVGSCECVNVLFPRLYAAGSPYWDAAHVTFDAAPLNVQLLLYQIPEDLECEVPYGMPPMGANAWMDAIFGPYTSDADVQLPHPPAAIDITIYSRHLDPVTVMTTVFGDHDLPVLAVRSPFSKDFTDLLGHWETEEAIPWYTRWEDSEPTASQSTESGDGSGDESSNEDVRERQAEEE